MTLSIVDLSSPAYLQKTRPNDRFVATSKDRLAYNVQHKAEET